MTEKQKGLNFEIKFVIFLCAALLALAAGTIYIAVAQYNTSYQMHEEIFQELGASVPEDSCRELAYSVENPDALKSFLLLIDRQALIAVYIDHGYTLEIQENGSLEFCPPLHFPVGPSLEA